MEKLIKIVKKYINSDLFSFETNKQKLYINFAFHSNAIEGNTLTLEETENIFTINRFSEKKSINDNLEIFDYKQAIKFILNQAKKQKQITQDFIKTINANVLKNTGAIVNSALGMVDSSKGIYRLSSVIVGTSTFPAAQKINSLMASLVGNYQKIENLSIIEAINKAADIHFDFVSIHPFYDGNGRTARLLMNYIMQINKLPFMILKNEIKPKYFSALKETRKKQDLTIFRNFIKEQFYKQLSSELQEQNNKNVFLSF